MFVTDDDKEDRWQVLNGEKLGPRPELREEVRRRAGVEFQITTPAYFLENVGKQLDVPVAKSSIDDASKVGAENRDSLFMTAFRRVLKGDPKQMPPKSWHDIEVQVLGRSAEEAVAAWIGKREPEGIVRRAPGVPFDFLLRTPDKRTTAIEVLVLRQNARAVLTRLRDICLWAFYDISKGSLDDLRIFVATNIDIAFECEELLIIRPVKPPQYDISIGVLLPNNDYEEVYRHPAAQSGQSESIE
jgi:hypothetical protein